MTAQERQSNVKATRNAPTAPAVGPVRLWKPGGVTLTADRQGLHFGTGGTWRSAPPDLLERFVKSCETTDDAGIVAFAREFGPLRLCKEDGLPESHRLHGFPRPKGETSIYVHKWANDEPIERWREIASQVAAVRRIVAALRRPQPVSSREWKAATSGPIPVDLPGPAKDRAEQRRQIAKVVSAFIACADLRPGIVWEGAKPDPRLEYRGMLFAALAHRLMSDAIGGVDLLECVVCGQQYRAKRAPRLGDRTYCPEHRKARARDTMRDTRRRDRAWRMSQEGHPLEEIAETLGVDRGAAEQYRDKGRERAKARTRRRAR